jgi:FlaA1/EpsC-like NDP-sugar epimerase
MVFFDACLVTASYLASYLLRFGGEIRLPDWELIKSSLPYIILFKLLIFYLFGLYRGMWRYTSLFDLFNWGIAWHRVYARGCLREI